MDLPTQTYRKMDEENPIRKIDEKSSSPTIRMIKFLMSKYDFKNNLVLNEVFAREKEGNSYSPVNPNTLYRMPTGRLPYLGRRNQHLSVFGLYFISPRQLCEQ